MRNLRRLGDDVAGLVHDRTGAVRRVFDDLAFGDVDDGGTVGVAVPGNDAAWLDRELAHAEIPALDVEWRLADVDRGDDRVGHSDRLEIDRLTGIGLLKIGWTFTGEGEECQRARSGDNGRKQKTAANSRLVVEVQHLRLSFVCARGR